MSSNLKIVASLGVLLLLPADLSAQMVFKKVETRTTYGRAKEGKNQQTNDTAAKQEQEKQDFGMSKQTGQ